MWNNDKSEVLSDFVNSMHYKFVVGLFELECVLIYQEKTDMKMCIFNSQTSLSQTQEKTFRYPRILDNEG